MCDNSFDMVVNLLGLEISCYRYILYLSVFIDVPCCEKWNTSNFRFKRKSVILMLTVWLNYYYIYLHTPIHININYNNS